MIWFLGKKCERMRLSFVFCFTFSTVSLLKCLMFQLINIKAISKLLTKPPNKRQWTAVVGWFVDLFVTKLTAARWLKVSPVMAAAFTFFPLSFRLFGCLQLFFFLHCSDDARSFRFISITWLTWMPLDGSGKTFQSGILAEIGETILKMRNREINLFRILVN